MANVVHGKLLYRQVTIANMEGIPEVTVENSIYKSNITIESYWIEQIINGERTSVFFGREMLASMMPVLTEIVESRL